MRKNTTKSIVTGGDAGSLAGAEPLAQLAAAAVSDGTALSAHGAPAAAVAEAPCGPGPQRGHPRSLGLPASLAPWLIS